MQGISVVAVSLVMLDRCGVVMHYITSLHQQSRSTNAIRILLKAATCVSSLYAQLSGGTGAGVRCFTSVFKLDVQPICVMTPTHVEHLEKVESAASILGAAVDSFQTTTAKFCNANRALRLGRLC